MLQYQIDCKVIDCYQYMDFTHSLNQLLGR